MNYTLGSTYRNGHIDTSTEIIPQTQVFKAFPDEKHVFEERPQTVSFYQITRAIEDEVITPFDKTVLSLIAVFGSSACTTKVIFEMLTLMGVETTKNHLENSLKRLHRYHLINFSRFRLPDGKQAHARIITLMKYGSQLARNLGVIHRFNPIATASATPSAIKSRAETSHLICNWLKNLPVERFSVRPVIVVDADNGAIIRPSASIDIWGSTLYIETPRRDGDWLESLIEKFHRYELVFGENNMPTVIINGEDPQMNLEISQAIRKENLGGEFLFTDDLAMYGKNFRTSLYSFDEENRLIRFSFEESEEKTAV